MQRSTRGRRPTKPSDAGSAREPKAAPVRSADAPPGSTAPTPEPVFPPSRKPPPAPRDPRFAAPLFVALATLTTRWRFYVDFKGAALDTSGPFYAIACALAALDAMLAAWGSPAAARTRALVRAFTSDSEIERMMREAARPTPYVPPVDEAPLFAELRALAERWDHTVFSSGSVPETREAARTCNDLLSTIVFMVDHWGSPAAVALFGFACDLVPEAQRAAAVKPVRPPGDASWLTALRAQVDDAIAAGLDATAPPAHRDLGRRMARQHIVEAQRAIEALFATVGGGPAPSREGAS